MVKSINPMNRIRTIIFFIILFLAGISCDEEPSSCYDKLQNGDETGIDCGGDCPPCSCFNGIKDDNEECTDCGGVCSPCTQISGRYIDPVFDFYDIATNLYYGSGITEPYGDNKDLLFSFFEPSGDTVLNRPLIIFIGQTTYAENADGMFFVNSINYLEDFVQKGYVVANIIGIRYWEDRIPLKNGAFDQAAMLIGEDIRGAVRYFKKNGEAYRIDTSNIWLMGASMGAMAALHAAYLDETDFSEIDPDLVSYIENDQGINPEIDEQTYSSRVKGVVILSGMIFDTRIIDHGEPYLFSIMGSEDAYRPFQCDMVSVNWIQEPHNFCGPEAIEERMKQEGFKIDDYRFKWIVTPPADHMAAYDYNQCPECSEEIITFIASKLGYCQSDS